MRYVARVAGRTYTIELQEDGHQRQVVLDERSLTLDWQRIGPEAREGAGDITLAQHISLLAEGRSYEAYARLVDSASAEAEDQGQGQTIEVVIAGQPYLVTIQDERSRAIASL